uniref:Transposase DDE domain-containing protein n=2 Tax=Candidatus Kentrum sp. LPFa TaxID=2126335 RepID=A0A450WSB9_9GAMM|nr:MAG: Transposase DDE domain-containing protein [Candidatus Kentron sp. LPFa]
MLLGCWRELNKGAVSGVDRVTARDAMGCQKKIAEQIVSQGADYILAVKDNQPDLHEAIKDYFETAKTTDFLSVPVSYDEQTNADHGRVEVRRCCLVNDISTLPQPENWAGLQSIALLESERHQGGYTTRESRYYITTLTGEAKPFANAVRAHWGIENSLHWVLDVTFREDDCRIRRNNAPANLNTVRQISLNLIKKPLFCVAMPKLALCTFCTSVRFLLQTMGEHHRKSPQGLCQLPSRQ